MLLRGAAGRIQYLARFRFQHVPWCNMDTWKYGNNCWFCQELREQRELDMFAILADYEG